MVIRLLSNIANREFARVKYWLQVLNVIEFILLVNKKCEQDVSINRIVAWDLVYENVLFYMQHIVELNFEVLQYVE